MIYLRLSLLFILLSSNTFGQPNPNKEFGNSLFVNEILASDGTPIIVCSNFEDYDSTYTASSRFKISYYTVDHKNVRQKRTFEPDFWKCDYAMNKAHETKWQAAIDNSNLNLDSLYQHWAKFAHEINGDSLFSQFMSGRKDSVELDTMRHSIMYKGYEFGLDYMENDLIEIEDQQTDEIMTILLIGHNTFPAFKIDRIRFRPGNYRIRLIDKEGEKNGFKPYRVVETFLSD